MAEVISVYDSDTFKIILACLARRSGLVPITNTGFYASCKLLSDATLTI